MSDTVSDLPRSETQVISVHYWASARSAAGVDADELVVDGPLTLAEVRVRLARLRPGPLTAVLDACSVLLGDRPVSTEDPDDVVVPPGATLEFLPPFAGG